MAGVSIDQAPNIDLSAIIEGGDEFMKRMAAFRDAKAAAEDAHAKLGIAKNVIELRDHAARAIEQANEEAAQIRAQAFAEATKAQASVAEWKQQTETATAADRETARQLRAEAEKMHLDAKAALAQANAKHAEASAKLEDVNAKQEAFRAAAQILGKA
jgi:hypothetical protein